MSSAERVRFHIPGHQGRQLFASAIDDPINLDSTELDGLDDLTNPQGCLKAALAQAADLYRVAHSFFMTQGSTVGIQAGMLALFGPDDVVLMPRNIHRAVVHGLILTGATPAWVMPPYSTEWGTWKGLTVDYVKQAHQANPNITGLVLPNPTYDGWAAEIEGVGQYCKHQGLKLLVDEAHGALWPLSNRLPQSACELPDTAAADVVVHSLHKTAGAVTPAALAHLPHGSSVSQASFQQCLNILHTSSPSYPLLANIEACCQWLASEEGRTRLNTVLDSIQQCQFSNNFRACNCPNHDPMTVLVAFDGHVPEDWAITLEDDYQISFEAYNEISTLYKVGLGAVPYDFERFQKALLILAESSASPPEIIQSKPFLPQSVPLPDIAMTPRVASFAKGESVAMADAVGRVALSTIAPCPPGIPVVMPGELIQQAHCGLVTGQILVAKQ